MFENTDLQYCGGKNLVSIAAFSFPLLSAKFFLYSCVTVTIYLVSSTDLFLQQLSHTLHPWDWNPTLHREGHRSGICIRHRLMEHWYLVLQEIQLKYTERKADFMKKCGKFTNI